MCGVYMYVCACVCACFLNIHPILYPRSACKSRSTYSMRQKKVPIYRPYYGTGNPVPFPFNFRPVAIQSPFVFNPFYGQPIRSINQVKNSLGSARN